MEIRRWQIPTIGFSILVRWHLYIESGLNSLSRLTTKGTANLCIIIHLCWDSPVTGNYPYQRPVNCVHTMTLLWYLGSWEGIISCEPSQPAISLCPAILSGYGHGLPMRGRWGHVANGC